MLQNRLLRRSRFQTLTLSQTAVVCVKLEPGEAGSGFKFVNAVKGGAVPAEFVPSVERGLATALQSGPLGGYPVQDVVATLHDGVAHSVDSSPLAFELAAVGACREGMRQAGMRLLEPVMDVEVTSPEQFVGSVMGSLSSRRGVLQSSTRDDGAALTLRAAVPLAEMSSYISVLRSSTQGRASFSMRFARYDFVPLNVQEAVTGQRAARAAGAV
ncbi:hypothetical protein H632_c4421p0 [Helicosporidium sp. ATCC 50920]|nr:hypothetical protein H632_c4421p0 [Helicosporidium sp. ATCC 50920]|eukprot:KDD71778.1 hypothetical protein H632_c4421p0 [Helicosporidium sp. ATCC 50920]